MQAVLPCLPAGAWDYEDNRRIVLEAIDMFGIDRCMFASNFPVDGLRVSFDRMFQDFKRMTGTHRRPTGASCFTTTRRGSTGSRTGNPGSPVTPS